MNLAIDIGNTLIKVGLFQQDEIAEVIRFDNEAQLLQLIKEKKPSNIIISTVRNNSEQILPHIPAETNAILLSNKTPLPVSNGYNTPETLGTDRISSIVGAFSLFPNTNCLVIDIGTCIKCDIIDLNNTYLGGSISPGIKMRFQSLSHYTSKLPLVEFEKTDFLNGKSTKESILSGVINGAVFEIEGFIGAYSKIFSQLNVIITGGDSYCFESRIKPHIFVVPDLVLLGLHKILLHNLSITSA
ncbi:MAG TPA: type III pantothenate kinase [Cytophagales bacterium]|nr:type III pantothenate kinase [Cytophagales bacterium]